MRNTISAWLFLTAGEHSAFEKQHRSVQRWAFGSLVVESVLDGFASSEFGLGQLNVFQLIIRSYLCDNHQSEVFLHKVQDSNRYASPTACPSLMLSEGNNRL